MSSCFALLPIVLEHFKTDVWDRMLYWQNLECPQIRYTQWKKFYAHCQPTKTQISNNFTIFVFFAAGVFTTVTDSFGRFINLMILLFWKHMTNFIIITSAPIFPWASSAWCFKGLIYKATIHKFRSKGNQRVYSSNANHNLHFAI